MSRTAPPSARESGACCRQEQRNPGQTTLERNGAWVSRPHPAWAPPLRAPGRWIQDESYLVKLAQWALDPYLTPAGVQPSQYPLGAITLKSGLEAWRSPKTASSSEKIKTKYQWHRAGSLFCELITKELFIHFWCILLKSEGSNARHYTSVMVNMSWHFVLS